MSVSSPIPVAQALEACADELMTLADQCQRLQHSLSPALVRDDVIEEGQALDLVTQSLAELGLYLRNLGADAPDRWRLDTGAAAGKVKLADLARRLRGAGQSNPASAGEFEFFGPEP